jgi:hypothetical protein
MFMTVPEKRTVNVPVPGVVVVDVELLVELLPLSAAMGALAAFALPVEPVLLVLPVVVPAFTSIMEQFLVTAILGAGQHVAVAVAITLLPQILVPVAVTVSMNVAWTWLP